MTYSNRNNHTVSCFVPYAEAGQVDATVAALKAQPEVANIYLLATADGLPEVEGCTAIRVDGLNSSATVRRIAQAAAGSDYTLLYTKHNRLDLGYLALSRMLRIAADSGAGMVYADYYTEVDGKRAAMPVIDYQEGSLRDDFNFGSVMLFHTSTLQLAAKNIGDYQAAGLYALRLAVSRLAPIVHINEYLYTDITVDNRRSGEKIFDYVDPKNRGVQIEMEQACTAHLKEIGAYLDPVFEPVDFNGHSFEREASVIIPVRNRVRTIRDAIDSVLSQQADFDFNVIVVDNHSTDGTTEAIREYAHDPRVVHVIPERQDLGIGGCWNLGAHNPACGKFAVQLDSDDLYSGPDTLAKIVRAFYDQQCAMVVGTYQLTDIDCNPIPPGVIDHKEWTPENGRNNALRINGLGAPRAFFTPMLREIGVPNTSYGEDYALGLAFSRHHQIGRIYDVLYLCRRWEDNSDANLDIVKMNGHNLYKDRIRTWEVKARRKA